MPAPPKNATRAAEKQRKKEKREQAAREAREGDAALKLAKEKVQQANEATDLLESFPVFRKYERNGINVVMEGCAASDVPKELMQKIFNLAKANMESLYNEAKFGPFDSEGWDDRLKMRELTEKEARYVIVRSGSSGDGTEGEGEGEFLGFMQYRWEVEDEEEIAYLYELQLLPEVTGKGLGKFLVSLLELAARKFGMVAVFCTVLKSNTRAVKFYKDKMKFSVDETSPDVTEDALSDEVPEYTYEILSKRFS